ncbi:MAG TPA: M23 family metallopeptidase [Nocardioides sp.]|uniref:M23 family metallopeptidase n=1 Tax=Nocardioides sp. TaxID=35761 RepID=UPI002F416B7B
MRIPLPHPTRVHGRRSLVVVAVLLAALVSLARPTGAAGVPVDPVPVGVWPLQPAPRVVRAFDPPDSTWGPGHRGVDLAGSVGQVVHTALAGRVTYAGRVAGRGVVVVDHGSTRTTYEPVSASVRVGDVLARGQPIGSLALAGSHCFPEACLHWGWLRGKTYLDPLLVVGGGPIVLLPLWRSTPAGGVTPVTQPYAALLSRLLARSSPPPTRSRDRRRTAPARAPVWRRPLAMRPLLL